MEHGIVIISDIKNEPNLPRYKYTIAFVSYLRRYKVMYSTFAFQSMACFSNTKLFIFLMIENKLKPKNLSSVLKGIVKRQWWFAKKLKVLSMQTSK